MINAEKIGKEIKRLRLKKGLTQHELASLINVSFQAVSGWERGVALPDFDNLIALSETFGVLVDGLLKPTYETTFLGVDGGGTKTEFVLASGDGKIVKRIVLPPCNPNDVGIEKCVALLCEGVDACLTDYPDTAGAFFGISGCGIEENRRAIYDKISSKYSFERIEVASDSANVFGLMDSDVAVILGTGTGVFYKTKDGKISVIGGWGYLLGDPASAYEIGKDVIRSAIEYEDGLNTSKYIFDAVTKRLGGGVRSNLPSIYKGSKSYIATFARIAFDAYKAGDAEAKRIIESNFSEASALVGEAIKRTGTKAKIVIVGGVAVNNADLVVKYLNAFCPARYRVCSLPPVCGACKNAAKGFEDENGDFYENFTATYKG